MNDWPTDGAQCPHQHDPGLTRPKYVMHPYRLSLAFLGSTWAGLDVEVPDPEIEPHAHSRRDVDGELIELSDHFGFGELQPVELIDLEYQIAQKIHAVTDPIYNRAYGLVDLQLLCNAGPELSVLRTFCVRTFELRNSQKWPSLPLRTMDGWKDAYREARDETQVNGESFALPSLDSTRKWLEQLITAIDNSMPGEDKKKFSAEPMTD